MQQIGQMGQFGQAIWMGWMVQWNQFWSNLLIWTGQLSHVGGQSVPIKYVNLVQLSRHKDVQVRLVTS